MHSLLEGVIKNFFKYWFSSEFSSSTFSIRKFIREIDDRIIKIKPPKFVPSTPRSIDYYNKWSAHEYLSFILYYALPVFRDVMRFDYYQNLKKLVVFIEIILSSEINVKNLTQAETIITEFVEEVSELYPPTIMLSGMHEMLHLVDCTLDFGPLNCINCFQFEELNRKLMRFLKGHDLIGEELIKIYTTAQILSTFSNNVLNTKLKEYIKSKLIFKSSNIKKRGEKSKTIIKNTEISFNQSYTKAFQFYIKKFDSVIINNLKTCNRIIYNGIIFTSESIKTKRSDSCFINKEKKIGLIQSFVIFNNTVYVIAKKIVRLMNAFNSTSCPQIESNLFVCDISEQLFVDKIENIKKVVLINISKENCFVSLFNSSHLFS